MTMVAARFWGGPMDGMSRVVEDFPDLRFPVMAGPVFEPQDCDITDHEPPYLVETYSRVGRDRRTGEMVYKYKPPGR